jgi:hypothetical protein
MWGRRGGGGRRLEGAGRAGRVFAGIVPGTEEGEIGGMVSSAKGLGLGWDGGGGGGEGHTRGISRFLRRSRIGPPNAFWLAQHCRLSLAFAGLVWVASLIRTVVVLRASAVAIGNRGWSCARERMDVPG